MIQNYFKKSCLLVFLLSAFTFAQTKEQIQEIKKETNISRLLEIAKNSKVKAEQEKQNAWNLADQKGWQKRYVGDDGNLYELIKATPNQQPIYYKTEFTFSKNKSTKFFFNVVAANATRADWLHDGGGLGLNVEGQNMTAYVWDGGIARPTHQEYDGIGGDDRVSVGNENQGPLNFHAGHVMGTIVASGFVSAAKGMAPQASGVAYDWTNDVPEVALAAANGMLLSNHSYGYGAYNIPDSWFGAYTNDSRDYDEVMFNAPYYLQVVSAGNDGNIENSTDGPANDIPLENNPAFDKLSAMKTSKNSMVIANARDPEIDNTDGSLISVTRNSSSSEGPTDDYRIKPDITGNGTGLFSTYASADDAYNTISGTSMSAPNITGSLLLLQQHYQNVNGSFMRAATLKGLALHTADDAGMTGPDAEFGWGLMNTKRAAEAISSNGLESLILEETIQEGETLTFTVKSDDRNPLMASISWTDAPGVLSSSANSDVPRLINDLDIRVSNETEAFLPWKLTGVSTNDKGDNLVDPYERVDVDNASGEYTITVTHKGSLTGGSVNFSLIVTGVDSDFRLLTPESLLEVCSNETAVFDLNYEQNNATTTNFTVENLPEGAQATFSSPSLSESGNLSLSISNLENVLAGNYTLRIIANNGEEQEIRPVTIVLFSQNYEEYRTVLTEPASGSNGLVTSSVDLKWEDNVNAESYFYQVSDSPSFNNILISETTENNQDNISGLEPNTVYYWRVRGDNRCGEGLFSEVRSFQTGIETCFSYQPTDYSSATIGTASGSRAFVRISIPDDLTSSKLRVGLELSHPDISKLSVVLQAASNLNIDDRNLLNGNCSNGENINAIFDDEGTAIECGTNPAISGTVKPIENFSPYIGINPKGRWFVLVTALEENLGGQIDDVTLTFCTMTENTNVPVFVNKNANIVANGPYTFTSNDILATTDSESPAEQIFRLLELPSKGIIQKNGVDLGIGDTFSQQDINDGVIVFQNNQIELFSDAFKVDINNTANGWLPNQTINLTATTLSNDDLQINGLNIFPNPSFGDINIRLNPKTNTDIQVTLFDLQGRVIIKKPYNNNSLNFNEKLNVRNLSTGVYLLNVREGSYSSTERIVISR